jgi:hypothetical protein
MAVKFAIVVLWNMTLCSLVSFFQLFVGMHWFDLHIKPEDGGDTLDRNVGSTGIHGVRTQKTVIEMAATHTQTQTHKCLV